MSSDLFKPSAEIVNEQYTARVTAGGVFSFGKKFTVAALARDLGERVEIFCKHTEALAKQFNAKVVVLENDSTDGTDAYLKAFASTHDFFSLVSTKFFKPKNVQDKSEKRKIEMAMYRNTLLDLVRPTDPDYLILMDSDIGGFEMRGLLHSLSYEGWDCMGSNGLLFVNKENNKILKLYYDSWAYRDTNSWEDKNVNLLDLPLEMEPFKVNSCFGGIALYKWNSIKNLRYNASDCDHVTLNKQIIAAGGSVYCNPKQIVIYNNINEQPSDSPAGEQIDNEPMEEQKV